MKKVSSLIVLLSVLSCSSQSINIPSNNTVPVKIKFKALADNQEIECGKEYSNIGTSKSKISFSDFRMYLSNIKFIDDKGKETELKLDQDKKWQNGNLGLLDFENKTGDCSAGTSETRKEITGTIDKANYKSLKFTLGVPFEQNHQDVNKADSPLNLTSMFWTWNSGYKFARIDMKTTGLPQGYYLHLASTGCTTDSMKMTTKHDGESHGDAHGQTSENANVSPTSCMYPNRSEITLANFDPEKNTVIIDISKLYENSNVDTNQDKTPGGCMSGNDDEDCHNVMNNLGLKFNSFDSKGQSVFRVE